MKKHLHSLFTVMLVVFMSTGANAQIGKCKGKYFGNIIAYSVPSNYTQLWNQTTSENGSKWGTIHRGTNNYNWTNSDLAYNTAKNSGGSFKFHALIWGAQAPGFLANASATQIETAIRQWYQAVQDHYAPMGGLNFIDVLNEPVNTPINREIANLKAALTLGYQNEPANAGDRNNSYGWAIWTFQLARKHFPNATLLINEFNIEHNWNNCRTEYIRMSNAIKNAPNLTDGRKNLIDGIGLQAHGIETLSLTAWNNCINQVWNETQLPLHITEFDIAADPNENHQRTKFQEFITAAWEHPRVAGITLWGYIQGSTWRPGNGQTGASGTDTGIMYANGQDRPAMAWLRGYLAGKPNLSCCPAPAPFAACNGSIAPTVSITAPANNTSFVSGTTINLTATATDADGTVSKVEFFNGTTKLGEDATAPYTYAWANAAIGTYNITAVATDNSGNKTTSSIVIVRVNVPQGPFNGTAHVIPGRIEAEHYDVGGQGVAYNEANTTGNEGGATLRNDDVDIEVTQDATGAYNVGYILNGEWLEYTVNVTQAGPYNLDLRMAADGAGKTLHVEMDGVNISGPITVPNTGGWQVWQTVTVRNLNLTAGQKVMRIAFDSDYMNLNFVEFKSATVTSLDEDLGANAVSVFPNPFGQEGFRIMVEEKTNYQIIDVLGQEIESGQLDMTTSVGQTLNQGTYLLKLSGGKEVRIAKITKQ